MTFVGRPGEETARERDDAGSLKKRELGGVAEADSKFGTQLEVCERNWRLGLPSTKRRCKRV
eukprot:4323998-Pleurochrysis_carterae.AAC.3